MRNWIVCLVAGSVVGCGDDGTRETTSPATTNTMTMSDITMTPTAPLPTTGDESTGETGSDTTAAEESTGEPATATTSAPGVCGDGVLDADEECDDGNTALTDACLPTCVAATCGDGALQTGVETCDDANLDDSDACAACQPAVCGDGFVQTGVEACDDGNAVDTDACRSTCVPAACGDGVVQTDVEACDDGNADDTDECTAACVEPSCSDTTKNGSESDVDCGGSKCLPCALGGACVLSSDCAASLCLAGTCGVPKSCQAIKAADPALPSGVYTIDIDANGGIPPMQVYCDQDTDGGGWTMVFKLSDGAGGDGSSLWNSGPLNDADVTLLNPGKSAKQYVSRFPSNFWNVNGVTITSVRVHAYTAGMLAKFWQYDGAATTALTWFTNTRLVASSYTDLPAGPFNYYSIAGDPGNGRRWFINQVYNGCPSDTGWLIVDSPADPCTWETRNGAPAPRILYAPGTTLVNWESAVNGNTIGVAEALAVFIR